MVWLTSSLEVFTLSWSAFTSTVSEVEAIFILTGGTSVVRSGSTTTPFTTVWAKPPFSITRSYVAGEMLARINEPVVEVVVV